MPNYADRLDKLKKQWDKDKPASGGAFGLPEGKHQCIIKRAVLEEGKASFNKGNVQVALYLEVFTGPHKGRKQTKWIDLEAPAKDKIPSGISQFKGVLQALGLDIPSDMSMKSIEACLKSLVNIVCDVFAKANAKGYVNVYINGAVHAAKQEDDDEEEAEEESDDDEEEDSDDDEEESEEEDEEEDKPAPKQAAKPKAPAKKSKKDDDDDFDDWDDDEK